MCIIDKIIDRIVQATGQDGPTKALKSLGISPSSAGNWKRRGTIPDGSLVKVAECTGVSFSWLKTGEGEMRPEEEQGEREPSALDELLPIAVEILGDPGEVPDQATITAREWRLLQTYRALDDLNQEHVETAAILALVGQVERAKE